jgi:hypothetical protein
MGIELKGDTVQKIVDAPTPATKKQLRSFLGLIGYYFKFITNFAAIAVPLTDLTRKGTPNHLDWSIVQQQAFAALKRYVVSPPVLRLPDFSKAFVLQTDASDCGIGTVLMQEDDGVKYPIAYASKKLLPRERNYSTIERECYAIVWGVHLFRSLKPTYMGRILSSRQITNPCNIWERRNSVMED